MHRRDAGFDRARDGHDETGSVHYWFVQKTVHRIEESCTGSARGAAPKARLRVSVLSVGLYLNRLAKLLSLAEMRDRRKLNTQVRRDQAGQISSPRPRSALELIVHFAANSEWPKITCTSAPAR
jgi:hypothetical protein